MDSKDFTDSDVENTLRTIGFSINKYLEVGKERDSVLKKEYEKKIKYQLSQNLILATLKEVLRSSVQTKTLKSNKTFSQTGALPKTRKL